MGWLLCLGHAGLAALLLPFAFADPRTRRRAIEGASLAGIALGVALVMAGDAGVESWRTLAFEPRTAGPAGAAAAAAWLVTGALAVRRARVEEAVLLGVASSGLILASTGRWVVPALLFWLCSSVALAVAARSRPWTWVVLAVSDAAVCVAALLHVWGEDVWRVGAGGPAAAAALVVAAVVRGGAHVAAPWPALSVAGGAMAPLVAGGAVVLAARAQTEAPWVALVLLVAASATAVSGVVRGRAGPRLAATWVTSLGVAVCFVSPDVAPSAGAAVALAVAAAALWPHTAGRAGMERALLVSAAPLTAGFGMVAPATSDAFGRSVAGTGSVEWSILAAVLPAALAAGVVVAARAARADVVGFVPEAVLATWVLAAAAVAVGVLPGMVGDEGPLGDAGGAVALQAAAVVAGLAAGVAARRSAQPVEPQPVAAVRADLGGAPDLPPLAARASLAVGAATVAAAGWLTVAGLRVGFL
ncbi:MAG TPA: hypothetical protein VHF45_02150 [Thermoleophilaceae bacterium]|nr:hypothetical protein [Thermoleophilaceae bacterium]